MGAKERAKAAEVAGVTAAAGAALIPGVGGAAAVILNYLGTVPMQRYTEQILEGIVADIADLYERTPTLALEVLGSDEFLAAVHRVIRAAQETPSEDKRTALRNALINGYVAPDVPPQRDLLLALVTKYETGHVVVLRCLAEIMENRGEMLDRAVATIENVLGDRAADLPVRAYLQDLVNDGLVAAATSSEVREENAPSSNIWRAPTKRQVVSESVRHSVTARGSAFLQLVRRPTGNASEEDTTSMAP